MIKTIEIEYIEGEMLKKIQEPLESEEFIEMVSFDEDNNKIIISYEENADNYYGLATLSALSVSLLIDYITYYSKYKNKEKEQSVLINGVLKDNYYANTLLIELIHFFNINTTLKEKIFFKFNMQGFDKELDFLIEEFEFESIIKKATDDIHNMLKSNGINFKKFSTLEVVFDEEDCFSLKTKDGTLLSPENVSEILKIDIEFQEESDDFLTILTFCCIIVSILKVKKLIVPSDFKELYDALLEQPDIINSKVKVELKNV